MLIQKYDIVTGQEVLGKVNRNDVESGLADVNAILTQSVLSDAWSFINPTGKICNVTVVSGGNIIEASVNVTLENINVYFNNATTGYIICN